MPNQWDEYQAKATVAQYKDVSEDIALRVYTSRLIGADPSLVLHGGGNTSVKVERTNLFGETEYVLHVKGSGWDLDTLEAPDFDRSSSEAELEFVIIFIPMTDAISATL